MFVITTGAMFSSGFFLLPGLAVMEAGPSVVLAYFISGLLILPAMLSQAELATAMPRAGGAYYFLDRTMGPLVGMIGGIGTWVTLILKSAFALIGMGAYLALVLDVPVKPVALAFTGVFMILNVVGARQSSTLLRVLVFVLLAVLGFFIVHGFTVIMGEGIVQVTRTRFTPFMPGGVDGLLGTVGLVFISYVGLTKIASVAEEITEPDRNIPLGMTLSLVTVMSVYVLGVFIMVATLGTERLSGSTTPVADAAGAFFEWIPPRAAMLLIVGAAVAAFASMANAGILAASRYPLAMARDHLVPERFAHVGRFGTPVLAILMTCSVLAVFLLLLDVIRVAKLASALQLLIFVLVNVAVIVMRESRIESYDPGFRSPLYPWVQIVGIAFPLVLVAEMGWFSALFGMGVMAVSIAWYRYYAQGRLARDGAIYHVFERLGRRRFAGLDRELRDIMKEKGARAEDPIDQVLARAAVIDIGGCTDMGTVIRSASERLAPRIDTGADALATEFWQGVTVGGTPIAHGAALLHTRRPGLSSSEVVLVRAAGGVSLDGVVGANEAGARETVHAVFLVVSGTADPGRHLRILAHLAARVEDTDFMTAWLKDPDEQALKETLLRDDRFFSLELSSSTRTGPLIGRALRELDLPDGCLVALIRRNRMTIVPRGRTVLMEGDRLTIIGGPEGLRGLSQRYSGSHRV